MRRRAKQHLAVAKRYAETRTLVGDTVDQARGLRPVGFVVAARLGGTQPEGNAEIIAAFVWDADAVVDAVEANRVVGQRREVTSGNTGARIATRRPAVAG